MKRLVKIGFLSLLVVVLVAADSEAQRKKGKGERGGRRGGSGRQRGGFGRGMRGGSAGLLRQESVLKELKITDEQKKKIKTAFAPVNGFREKLQDLSREERFEAMREMGEIAQKAGKAAVALLNKEQKERLDQLMLQQSGSRALQQEEMQKKLGFTKKQTRKLASVLEAQRDKQSEMFQELRASGGGFEGMREKMQEMRKKNDKEILGVLTKKQTEKFESLKGKKFKFESRGRRRKDV